MKAVNECKMDSFWRVVCNISYEFVSKYTCSENNLKTKLNEFGENSAAPK